MRKLIPSFSLLIILVVVFAYPSFSQDRIQGVVVEENEKGELQPLIGANVIWLGSETGTSADTNGVFTLPYKPEYTRLIVSYIGYRADTVLIEKPDQLTIILKNSLNLDEVEVVYRKNSTEVSFMDVIKTEVMGEQELFKAACCNLSESFETNPSVDVSFTDAVTGTRQIQMLGLAGPYIQISQENMPYARGLATIYGLTYIPGTWMNSIQVTKGMGPVTTGFESIAGQINVELKEPDEKETFFVNAYGNQEGRLELNMFSRVKISEKLSSSILVHGKNVSVKSDHNLDSFLDVPIGNNLFAMNRWKYIGSKGVRMQAGVKWIGMDDWGGQKDFEPLQHKFTDSYYGFGINTKRVEGFGKIGYVFPKNKFSSIGLQFSGVNHEQSSYFGFRQYDATQQTGYANFIFQTIINNTQHKIKGGISYLYDQYDETLDSAQFERTEIIPGSFVEYTYAPLENITLVAGARVDHHNDFGTFFTPRLHFRYCLAENTVFRASFGKGWRTPNVIAENLGMLASARRLILLGDSTKPGYGFEPEVAWNYGLNITHTFTLDYRNGSIGFDYYHTDFENQLIMDLEQSHNEVWFYNLTGPSYSNSFQVTLNYELVRRLDLRLAYRWFDVKMSYGTDWDPVLNDFGGNELRLKPLLAVSRAFANVGYSTKSKWQFDATLQWQGEKRIPYHPLITDGDKAMEKSPSFIVLNSQVTKGFGIRLEAYLGAENILNFKQDNPILSAENPFGPDFDSSLIWAPIFGRMFYLGVRYKI